jgi:Fur family ferric uptake transcriptional regulator
MGAFTVEELAEHVSAIPQTPVGLATVYRAVKALADAGSLEKVGTRRGSDLYVWCMKEGHHHHVVCTSCGAVGDAPCPFGTGAEAPGGRGSNAGFKILTHEATFYGLCPRCARLENGD